ncbi:4'-phosphopantetheinyl transferase superfamily protein [Kitasatospora sp. NPDC085895]|uniref:4'-phosphopantetheinyl transferase family protein n=1 Tax=Kitasatospora sp. NPDC085895 TaxID=3155057 RepID=UPI00344EB85D
MSAADGHRVNATAAAPLGDGRVDLWLLRQPHPDDITGALDLSELDERELARASACRRQTGGFLYASAHIALRRLLGAYLHHPAAELEFTRQPCPCCDKPHGRPALSVPDSAVHFSLSHSSGMALVGIASAPIGVDVEQVPRASTVEVCSTAIHPAERTEIEAVPQPLRRAAFGQLWTRKEAYLKGLGTGLGRPLAEDYLGADAAARPPGWTVVDIPCGPRHTGAAAVRTETPLAVSPRWIPVESLYTGATVDLSHLAA